MFRLAPPFGEVGEAKGINSKASVCTTHANKTVPYITRGGIDGEVLPLLPWTLVFIVCIVLKAMLAQDYGSVEPKAKRPLVKPKAVSTTVLHTNSLHSLALR